MRLTPSLGAGFDAGKLFSTFCRHTSFRACTGFDSRDRYNLHAVDGLNPT